jgi:hypothetical protein
MSEVDETTMSTTSSTTSSSSSSSSSIILWQPVCALRPSHWSASHPTQGFLASNSQALKLVRWSLLLTICELADLLLFVSFCTRFGVNDAAKHGEAKFIIQIVTVTEDSLVPCF